MSPYVNTNISKQRNLSVPSVKKYDSVICYELIIYFFGIQVENIHIMLCE